MIIIWSPLPLLFRKESPFPFNLKRESDWTPWGILNKTLPSIVGTSTLSPKVAWAKFIGRVK